MSKTYVGTAALAAALNTRPSWIRTMVAQKIMDDNREQIGRGCRFLLHMEETQQLIVAQHLRKLNVGLDTIRIVVDQLFFDNEDLALADFDEIYITVDKAKVRRRAQAALRVARSLEHGTPYREHVGDDDGVRAVST